MAQGKALTPEDKKAVVALKEYFDRTKNDLQEQASPIVQKVSIALGFGIATVKRTMADYRSGVNFDKMKKVFRGRPNDRFPIQHRQSFEVTSVRPIMLLIIMCYHPSLHRPPHARKRKFDLGWSGIIFQLKMIA